MCVLPESTVKMSVDVLPDELFESIFRYLEGVEVIRSEAVCARWRRLVRALGEGFWRGACAREHADVYAGARWRAGGALSWRELYRSLWLWRRVARARVLVRDVHAAPTDALHVLRGGALACPQPARGTEHAPPRRHQYSAIAYFDPDTLQESRRESFEFTFQQYAESERLLLVAAQQDDDSVLLCLTLKPTSRGRRVMLRRPADHVLRWALRGDALYYQTAALKLCRVRPVEIDDDIMLESTTLADLPPYMEDVAPGPDQLKILTGIDGNLAIYSLANNRLQLACRLEKPGERLTLLRQHGFEWGSQDVVSHLRAARWGTFEVRAARAYGSVVLLGTRGSPLTLHVLRAHAGAELDVCCTPELSVELEQFAARDAARSYTVMRQIEVVETRRGHRVIVLLHCSKLLVIDLAYPELQAAPDVPRSLPDALDVNTESNKT